MIFLVKMETLIINDNTYKYVNLVEIVTTINGKEISTLKVKDLKKFREEIEDWIYIQRGLESLRTERTYTPSEARQLLKKWQES